MHGFGPELDCEVKPEFSPERRRFAAAFALAPLALAVPGCTWTPWRREEPSPPVAEPPTDVLESWRAIGKLAARAREGNGHWSAAFDWRQNDEDFQLRLSGPFGQGGFEVKGRPGRVEFKTAKGRRRTAATPEALFDRELGLDLPASSLRHWITARARRGVPVEEWTLDDAGRLASLAQQGWRVEYRYPAEPDGHSLPNRITLHGKRVVVRVIVRDWRLE